MHTRDFLDTATLAKRCDLFTPLTGIVIPSKVLVEAKLELHHHGRCSPATEPGPYKGKLQKAPKLQHPCKNNNATLNWIIFGFWIKYFSFQAHWFLTEKKVLPRKISTFMSNFIWKYNFMSNRFFYIFFSQTYSLLISWNMPILSQTCEYWMLPELAAIGGCTPVFYQQVCLLRKVPHPCQQKESSQPAWSEVCTTVSPPKIKPKTSSWKGYLHYLC